MGRALLSADFGASCERSREGHRHVRAGSRDVCTSSANEADEKTTAVDDIFRDYAKAGSPGCALAIYRDGAIIHEKGYGLANIEQGTSITPRSVFDIGFHLEAIHGSECLIAGEAGKAIG